MNAVNILKSDHKSILELFKKFERVNGNAKDRRAIANDVIRQLAIHAAVEEEIVYPLLRSRFPNSYSNVLEALEEHHLTKVTLSELQSMPASSDRFIAKFVVLIDSVRQHITEEERVLLPALNAIGRDELADLGRRITRARKMTPTRPHPSMPDSPPANIVANRGAALVDRVMDMSRSAAEMVVDTANRAADRGRRVRKGASEKVAMYTNRGRELTMNAAQKILASGDKSIDAGADKLDKMSDNLIRTTEKAAAKVKEAARVPDKKPAVSVKVVAAANRRATASTSKPKSKTKASSQASGRQAAKKTTKARASKGRSARRSAQAD